MLEPEWGLQIRPNNPISGAGGMSAAGIGRGSN